MAIESYYWKAELRTIRRQLLPSKNPKRWSEKRLCNTERNTMVGFFIVRRLLELQKLSIRLQRLRIEVWQCQPQRNIHFVNRYSLEDNYDFSKERRVNVSVHAVCNQFIHAYMSILSRDNTRNWSDFMIFSDFERNKNIWRVPVPEILKLFEMVANDKTRGLRASWNPTTNDYDVRSF